MSKIVILPHRHPNSLIAEVYLSPHNLDQLLLLLTMLTVIIIVADIGASIAAGSALRCRCRLWFAVTGAAVVVVGGGVVVVALVVALVVFVVVVSMVLSPPV